MAKTKEELDELRKELNTLKDKLKDLDEDELIEISGGGVNIWDVAVKQKEDFDPKKHQVK